MIKNKHKLPQSTKYLSIILPGDAPDSRGKMLYFTPKDAEKLAKHIAKIAKKSGFVVLVTNGPRTGKHDPETGKELVVHQNNILDATSAKFIDILENNKVLYKLFDFQKGQPSNKELIYGAVIYNKDSKIFVPGESTSMVSEAVDIMPSYAVTIYHNAAMNDNHYKHVKAELRSGRASVMDLSMKIVKPKRSTKKAPSASAQIAKVIFDSAGT
ncbi:MAG UNVERIFIED_CONTAM: hypothetical protein LVQ98_05200 [Rickettsiaceae bacterium]|jgi:hypothetical protein